MGIVYNLSVSKKQTVVARVLGILWILVAVIIVTSQPSTQFVLLEPGSFDHFAILIVFFVTSVGLYLRPGQTSIFWIHFLVITFLFLIRPRSRWIGRDACIWILLLYIFFFLFYFEKLRPQIKLFLASIFLSWMLLDIAASSKLRQEKTSAKEKGSIDYGDIIERDNPGGYLEANLSTEWLGEFEHSRIITDRFGFRTSKKTTENKPPNVFRILFIGDSFVVGMRTDQSQTMGHVLEMELQRRVKEREVQVLIAGQQDPAEYFSYVQRYALRFQPDLILVGLTLGNDFSTAYLNKNKLSVDSTKIHPRYLPSGAYEVRPLHNLHIKLDRSLKGWDAYKLLRRSFYPHGIYSWNHDYPGRLSSIDVSSGLSYYFRGQSVPMLDRSIADAKEYLLGIKKMCEQKKTSFAIVIFPQRFQIQDREWDAAMFDYGLNEVAFDRDRLNQILFDFCLQEKLFCIDPTEELRLQKDNLYFPNGDMHFNSRGQSLVGRYIAARLLQQQLL